MTKSMTGFARCTVQTANAEIVWELKTVNHRYLDVTVRLPDGLRRLEMGARELIQKQLGRGKLEASCYYRPLSEAGAGVTLDTDKVNAVVAACNEIEMQMGGIGQTLSALDVLRFPGVVGEQTEILDDESVILGVLSDCLSELKQNREAEGSRMQQAIVERAEVMQTIVAGVREQRPQVIEAIQNKLRKRVNELTEDAQNERLEQELVIIAQKMDVDEELDRLDSHIQELTAVFERAEPIGRRLDFLMQEFNREANTLGAKSADVKTTQAAIEIKVLIEQMREQVQNIE